MYPDEHFDVVLSAGFLQHLRDSSERHQALQEMCRVLKPGGRLLIQDDYFSHLEKDAQSMGLVKVSHTSPQPLWLGLSQLISAEK